MKKWIALALGAVAIFSAVYFGSAYWAARQLRDSAISGDADALDEAIDFPAVRLSLKSQLMVAMTKKMQTDPKLKDNPFAGFAIIMAPAIVDRAVDGFVTPEGMSAMVRGQKPNAGQPATREPNSNVDSNYEWVSTDRFRVHLKDRKTGKEGPSLLFDRRGVASWKLIKVEIPEDTFEET